ncbi:unnamed protein product, partial [Timema podura]|nr:unnamed protein product [Timema podura]
LKDEIGDFLGSILMRPHPAPVRPVYTPPSPAPLQRTVVRGERVNKIPSTPSDTPESSEPSSPAAKRSRPGTPLNVPPVNVPSSVVSTTASPAKPTLSTLSTLVSVSALNAGPYTLGDTGSIPGALQDLICQNLAMDQFVSVVLLVLTMDQFVSVVLRCRHTKEEVGQPVLSPGQVGDSQDCLFQEHPSGNSSGEVWL